MIEPVYQFSLDFYINIFEKAVEKSPPGRNERVKNINITFTLHLYQNLIRSLLEKDKLTFSLLLCIRIL
jgi:dynein heavy chain